MADLWERSDLVLKAEPGTWRCIVAGQTLGPLSLQNLIDKLLIGALDEQSLVARDDSEFLPLEEVAALAAHVPAARAARGARLQRRSRRQKATLVVLALGLLAGASALGWQALQRRGRQQLAEQRVQAHQMAVQQEADTLRVAAEAAQKAAATPMELVPLVSLGRPQDVRLPAPTPKPPVAGTHRRRKRQRHKRPPAEVQSCLLTQQMVFSTLRGALGAINHCVVAAKRGPQQFMLPSRLALSFVVQPGGRVVDFAVEDAPLRRGPLRDCLAQVFTRLRFPVTHGAACPVTLPLKVGP